MDIIPVGHRRAVRLTGNGLPALVKWNGLDKKGNVVPDGDYIARLEVIGNKNFSAQTEFKVDTRAPDVSLSLSTTVFDSGDIGNKPIDFVPYIFDASAIDHWLVQVINSSGRTVRTYWSSGPVAGVSWDGTDEYTRVLVPQGDYRCAVQAWDKAGNESQVFFAELTVNVTAREMLAQALHNIQVNETAIGLIVQLDQKDLFLMQGKKFLLTQRGVDMLRETAILINAYPEAPVKLDGYSWISKDAQADRSQGSIYAWNVYSYLIKVGNVKASRVTVRGRGRSAMFDRRSVNLPFIRNGIEVVLEGNGKW